jgi:hypothetical protein
MPPRASAHKRKHASKDETVDSDAHSSIIDNDHKFPVTKKSNTGASQVTHAAAVPASSTPTSPAAPTGAADAADAALNDVHDDNASSSSDSSSDSDSDSDDDDDDDHDVHTFKYIEVHDRTCGVILTGHQRRGQWDGHVNVKSIFLPGKEYVGFMSYKHGQQSGPAVIPMLRGRNGDLLNIMLSLATEWTPRVSAKHPHGRFVIHGTLKFGRWVGKMEIRRTDGTTVATSYRTNQGYLVSSPPGSPSAERALSPDPSSPSRPYADDDHSSSSSSSSSSDDDANDDDDDDDGDDGVISKKAYRHAAGTRTGAAASGQVSSTSGIAATAASS